MTAASDLISAKNTLVTDVAIIDAIVNGPSTGPTSTVTLPNGAVVKTLARLAAEATAGYMPLAGGTFAGTVIAPQIGINCAAPSQKGVVTGTSGASGGGGTSGILAITTGTGVNTDNKIEFGLVDASYGWINALKPGTAQLPLVLSPGGGGLGVGTTAPAGFADLRGDLHIGESQLVRLALGDVGVAVASCGVGIARAAANGTSVGNGLHLIGYDGFYLYANSGNFGAPSAPVLIGTSTTVRPGTDNAIQLGNGSFRYSVLYAATGSINTSGRTAKRNVFYVRDWNPADADPLKAAAGKRLRVGARLLDKVASFQLLDSILQKGREAFAALTAEQQAATSVEAEGEQLARFHAGLIHDDVVAACVAEGLDPYREGFVCRDPEMVEEEYEAIESRQVEEDAAGFQVVIENGVPVRKATTFKRPVFDLVAVRDEVGEIVTTVVGQEPTGVVGADGQPVMRDVTGPLMHPVPRMHDVAVVLKRTVPSGNYVEALRYDELWPLIVAAIAAGVTVDG